MKIHACQNDKIVDTFFAETILVGNPTDVSTFTYSINVISS